MWNMDKFGRLLIKKTITSVFETGRESRRRIRKEKRNGNYKF